MKRVVFIITLGFIATFSIRAQGLIVEKVIAKVGSEDIFYSEVQELYGYAKAQNPDYGPEVQCDIMEQLITKSLLIDQARLDSIEISDVELDAQLDRRIEYILQQMGGDEELFKNTYKRTPLEQREEMREPMRKQMLEERIQGTLINEVEITPSEVIDFFERIPSDSLPYLPAEVELGEISIKTRISNEVKQAAYDKLERVRSRILDDGESFEELASVFSDDPGSAAQGGNLAWAKRGSYVPEFEAMAFSLEQGELSEIVETQFGYHIMELLERRGNNIRLRHILIKPEITDADIQKTVEHLDSVKNLIVTDSLKFEFAVKIFGDDETQSYSNAGRMLNPNTGDTFWETGQLPYQIYFAIEGMEENDVSEVLQLDDERGEKVYKLIQLITKTKPHSASLETDFTKIKQYAIQSKKNEYFNEWMLKKIKGTFIEVLPAFEACPNLDKFLMVE